MKTEASALVVAAAFLSTGAVAGPKYSAWGPAVNLAADHGVLRCGGINTASNDAGPAISKDGLSLYFSSGRPGNVGGDKDLNDIYVVQRQSVDSAWGTPSNLRNVNSGFIDSVPSFSRDGHWMFLNSNRGPLCKDAPEAAPYCGYGDLDIWVSYRSHVHDAFAWETPMNLGPGVNTSGFEAGAGHFENDDGNALLYFGRGDAGFPPAQTNPTVDIWVAELQPDGTFGNARTVPQLNSDLGDQRPSVRFDGLEIFFYSNREGSLLMPDGKTPSSDIWVATRQSLEDPWNAPVRLVNEVDPTSPIDTRVNTEAGDFNPQISPDGLTLYFASGRANGCGGFDIYMTTRTMLKGNSGE